MHIYDTSVCDGGAVKDCRPTVNHCCSLVRCSADMYLDIMMKLEIRTKISGLHILCGYIECTFRNIAGYVHDDMVTVMYC